MGASMYRATPNSVYCAVQQLLACEGFPCGTHNTLTTTQSHATLRIECLQWQRGCMYTEWARRDDDDADALTQTRR
jgi:hypothetical protein